LGFGTGAVLTGESSFMTEAKPITLVEALNQAFHYEMEHDSNVVMLGEDIGRNGGVFRATVGLFEKFGADRVMDTPIDEAMITGLTIGLAAQGFRPIAEYQFMGFIYAAIENIIDHAARLRNRTRGRLTCPAVFRAPYGGGIRALEHHSESTESMFAQIPGIRVVVPSSPVRAYGLMLASIRNADPVVFLEPKRIYRWVKQRVPDNGNALRLDACFTLKKGNSVTVITWGASIKEVMAVALELEKESIGCEVVDVATLSPIDFDTILESVDKTGRCVIVHEAPRNCGVGAEIAAHLAEHAMGSLRAPVQRVTGFDTIMPYYRLEKHYMPDEQRIYDAVKYVMDFR
jgi:pyruvate dehydrogenase E1 component beta subunit